MINDKAIWPSTLSVVFDSAHVICADVRKLVSNRQLRAVEWQFWCCKHDLLVCASLYTLILEFPICLRLPLIFNADAMLARCTLWPGVCLCMSVRLSVTYRCPKRLNHVITQTTPMVSHGLVDTQDLGEILVRSTPMGAPNACWVGKICDFRQSSSYLEKVNRKSYAFYRTATCQWLKPKPTWGQYLWLQHWAS